MCPLITRAAQASTRRVSLIYGPGPQTPGPVPRIIQYEDVGLTGSDADQRQMPPQLVGQPTITAWVQGPVDAFWAEVEKEFLATGL
jgi:hypothetical protein